ncbi:hypothetical protein Tco_1565274, partial [Tanacetum coccineum]
KEACSKGWEAEERVCSHAQTATTSAPNRDTQKRSQKVRTVEAALKVKIKEEEIKRGGGRLVPAVDPIEIHNIKQRDGESTEDFVKRYKLESKDVKGAPECMRIFGFVHGITNPELIKRLHDKILKTVDEMMRVTTSFLRGEVAASNHERKKLFPPWK